MFERSIGIRLTLLPAFAEATKLILSNVGDINKGLQTISDQGSKINVDGLKILNTELMTLVGSADAAKKAVSELNGIKISKNVLSALQMGMKEVSVAAKATKQDIQEVGQQAEQTSKVVQQTTAAETQSFSILNAEIMKAERALAKLGVFAMPEMHTPIITMRSLNSEIMLAEQAMRRLDSFAPRQLEDTVLRLNSGLQNLRMLASSQQPLMLGPGPAWATGNAAYNNVRSMSLGAGGEQEQTRPWTSVTGDRPNMLGPGNWTGNNITPYNLNAGMNPQSTPYEPGNGHQVYEGPGDIMPYNQDLGRANWMPRGEPGPGENYPPIPPVNYGGSAVMNAGRGIMRHGDIIQSTGWSAAMPAIMLESVLGPALKSQMDIQDLYGVAGEALQAVGAKPQNYNNIMGGAEEASTKYGGSLRENVSGMYTFASSVPALSKVNWNDPQQIELMKQSYEKITEGSVVGGRSTHPVSQEHSILDILASVSNLGMPMANAKQLANSIKVLTDVFTNVKNSTSTDFDLLGSTIRNVGTVAHNMGVSWQDTMALTGLLAEGKYRGSIAGTSIKRIFSRQSMDPKQARDMEAMVAKFGGNISMYDKEGKTLSPLDFFANIAQFEDQHHLSSKAKSKMETSLSGLYAGAPMGELINLARGFGGSAGLKKYEEQLIGTAPGATDRAYETRDQGGKNVKIESQKIDNSWQLEMHKTFLLMNNDIIAFLHGVQKVIIFWDGLPGPVKKGAVELGFAALAFSALVGVSGILIGNFIKLGGAFTFVGGSALKLGEHLMGMGFIFPKFSMGIEKLSQSTIGLLPRAFAASGSAIAGFLTMLGPVGITIAALVIVVGGLALAWSKDWGGIREKTASAVNFIGTVLKDIPKNLGFVIGEVIGWGSQLGSVMMQAANKMVESFNKEMQKGIPAMLQDGKDMVGSFFNGLGTWYSNLDLLDPMIDAMIAKFKSVPGKIWADLTGGIQAGRAFTGALDTVPGQTLGQPVVGDGAQSGKAFADQFGNGTVSGLNNAKNKIKAQGLQPIRDLFPSSEPKDSSSPLSGMGKSGVAYSDAFINAAIIGLSSGKAKVKKAAKPIGDVFLELKSTSVQQVQEMAKQIEQELIHAGAVVKDRWIDLYNPQTHQITRVHGDEAAYKVAIGSNVHDDSVQKAHDYLQKIQREIIAGLPVNIDKAIATLTSLSVHALSAHAMAEINEMISVLRGAARKAGDTIKRQFEDEKKSFNSGLENTNRAGDRFDLIQQDAKIPQLGSDPTSKDLKSVISAETAERNALASALLTEKEDAGELAKKYTELEAKISQLNTTTKYGQAIYEQLHGELESIGTEYNAVTSRITQQKSVVDNLTASILQQNTALKTAKDTWSGLFYNIQQHNAALLIDQNFKSLADHVQNYFNLQNSAKGPAGNSADRQQANNFANQFMQQLFQGLFDTSSNASLLEKLIPGHGGRKGNKHEAGEAPTPAQSQLIEKTGKSNELLEKIEKNTEYIDPKNLMSVVPPGVPTGDLGIPGLGNLTPGAINGFGLGSNTNSLSGNFNNLVPGLGSQMNTSGTPMAVSLWDQAGSQELGTNISTALTQITTGLTSVTKTQAPVAKTPTGDAASKTTLSQFQTAATEASDALSLLNGLRAGGIGGGMEAGSSASSLVTLLGGSAGMSSTIGIVAGVLGAIGIGPHETPVEQPDINDPTYQQLLPNWAGTQQTLNGNVIQPNQQYSSYMGNQNEAQQTYAFLSNPSSMIGLNPTQVQQSQQLLALANNSKTGVNMGAAGLAISSEHQGQLTLASGQTISVTDFENLVQTSQGLLTAFNNNVLQQQQNADRLASSFTSFVLNGPAGFTMPDFVGGGSGSRGVNTQMPSSASTNNIRTGNMGLSTGIMGVGASTPGNVTVTILQGATINGANQQEVEAAIQNQLPAIVQAVNGSANTTSRLTGSYVSNTF